MKYPRIIRTMLPFAFWFLLMYCMVEVLLIQWVDSPILRYSIRYFLLGFGGMTAFFAALFYAAENEDSKTSRSIGGLVLHFLLSIVLVVIYRLMFFEVPITEIVIALTAYIFSLCVYVLLIVRRK